jgi:putative ABC transport system ATP-binding protein
MIHIQDLKFKYPKSTFSLSISKLDIAAGEKVAIIGPSGSGKTTLLHLVAGIFLARSGELKINGQELKSLSDKERRNFRANNIGFIFQDFRLLDYLSVFDNILHSYRINNSLTLNKSVKDKARELAGNVHLADKLNRLTDNLSQGEKQRVAIARALLSDPKIILADEPTGNLDPKTKNEVLDSIFESVAAQNATLLLVTHAHEDLKRFDRVIDFEEFYTEVTT